MNLLLDQYNKLKLTPEGKFRFSRLVCDITPYFASIDPIVNELRPGYGSWSMTKTRKVENHIATVHAIAMCNLCEITAGLTCEVSIPDHKRWIPMGMSVEYLKKARTDLTAICELGEVEWDRIDSLETHVKVFDTDSQCVMTANILMKIGDKKPSQE